MFLRGITSGREFQLATNVKGAGSLDDVVFKYKPSEHPSIWHTSFLQLKHKEAHGFLLSGAMLKAARGKFSLNAQLKSYRDIKTELELKKNALFEGSIEFCDFIVYTNTSASEDMQLRKRDEVKGEIDEYLPVGNSEGEIVFKFEKERDADIYAAVSGEDNEVVDFLSKLKVFTGQPSESELDDVIKKELIGLCVKHGVDIDSMYRIYEEQFKTWWRDSMEFLDQNSSILLQSLNQALAEALVPQEEKKFRLDVKFEESATRMFEDLVSDKQSRFVNILVERSSLKIASSKLLQVLETHKGSYIFVGSKCLLASKDSFLSSWTTDKKTLLVIVGEDGNEDEKIADVCAELSKVFKEENDKRIIFLSTPNDAFINALQDKMETRCEIIEDSFEFSQLDQHSSNKILNKEVILQGHTTTLDSMLEGGNENISTLFSANVIEMILTNNNLSVGKHLEPAIENFISRTLTQKTVVRQDIFNARDFTDTVIISGLTPHNSKDIINLSDESLFSNLEEGQLTYKPKRCSGNVHYIDFVDNKLIWKKTRGSIASIKRYVDENEARVVTDLRNRVILLAADPGMGKTTYLSHLAQQTKNTHPNYWVVNISLNDHATLLAKSEVENFSAEEFLASALGLDKMSPVVKSLFKYALNHSGNVAVMLDAFDEIAPKYLKTCCALVTSLLKTKVKHVWVSSRHSMQEYLENHLSTLAICLQVFNEEDQRRFLLKHWVKSTDLSASELNGFVSKLLKITAQSMNDEMSFACIPLQTHMLAEVFQDVVSNETVSKLPEQLDLLQLIEQFVERKVQLYAKKKYRVSEENVYYEEILEEQRRAFYKKHSKAALVLLLNESDLQKIHYKKIKQKCMPFLQKIKEGKEKTGIIDNVIDDTPVFLHRIFAEYFAAKWFSKKFLLNRDFIQYSFTNEQFKHVAHKIFDQILAQGHKLHTAVFNSDLREVVTLLDRDYDVDERDKGGRSALHLAVTTCWYNQSEKKARIPIIKTLMSHKARVDIEDDVLTWTPLQYADGTLMMDVIDLLLEDQSLDVSKLVTIQQNMHDRTRLELVIKHDHANVMRALLDLGLPMQQAGYDCTESLLHKAGKHGSVKIARLLISRGCDVKTTNERHATPLHRATKYVHLDVVQLLVDSVQEIKAEYVNSRDIDGDTALLFASQGGRCEMIRILVEAGADLTVKGELGRTPLMVASLNGHKSVVEELLAVNSTLEYINSTANEGCSALHLAARKGRDDIVLLLVKSGADVNLREKSGRTPLIEAALNGRKRSVEILLGCFRTITEKTVYVNIKDNRGDSAVYLAAQNGFLEVTDVLINSGGDVITPDKKGQTPLMKSSETGHTLLVQLFLDCFTYESNRKEYINKRDNEGLTALHLASRKSGLEIVELLLRAGADVTIGDLRAQTPLISACILGHFAVAKVLLDTLPNDKAREEYVNTFDAEGSTALHRAIRQGNTEIVNLLINAGGDFSQTDGKGYNIFMQASFVGNKAIISQLLSRFSDATEMTEYVNRINNGHSAMNSASKRGHFEIVRILIESGASITTKDLNGLTPLIRATKNGHKDVVQLLLDNVADEEKSEYVNVCDNELERSAIFWATEKGNREIFQLLIDAGGNIVTNDNKGYTPLMRASFFGKKAIVKLITASVSDLNARRKIVNKVDNDGRSALQMASGAGHDKIVEILLQVGAENKIQDNAGLTPLMEAAKKDHQVIARLLLASLDEREAVKYIDVCERKYQRSALHLAARNGNSEIVQLLIRSGGNLALPDNMGNTPLMLASFRNHLPVVRSLLQSFSDNSARELYVKMRNNNGCTALLSASRQGDNEIIKLLLSSGGDLKIQDNCGVTPLMANASHGHKSAVVSLLDFLEDFEDKISYINTTDNEMNTAMHYSAKKGHYEIVHLFINSGGDVHRQDLSGWTPLMVASFHGHLKIVQLLLVSWTCSHEKANYVNIRDKDTGRNAILLAAESAHNDIIETLIEHGGDILANDNEGFTVLLRACSHGLKSIVELLLSSFTSSAARSSYVNAANKEGDTALLLAARKGHYSIIELLVAAGGDVTVPDRFGRTPLMRATRWRHRIVVAKLLESFSDDTAKADYVNTCRVPDGKTALIYAAEKGHNRITEMLIQSGGDINLKDSSGLTPLTAAAMNGHKSVVEVLLAGVTRDCVKEMLDERDPDGDTAMSLAEEGGHQAVVELLKAARLHNSSHITKDK